MVKTFVNRGAVSMKIVFYSLVLNNHQACVADELWELTGHRYCFVELANMQAEHRKDDTRNYDDCPYLLRAWVSAEAYDRAKELARSAECCVFSGVQALPFQKERMKLGLLSFDMSERWLKRGLLNLFSPAIFKMFVAYHTGGWRHKPLYKLCCSAFAAQDQYRLGTYRSKCYKWGYFTKVGRNDVDIVPSGSTSETMPIPLMWCARYLKLKHAELPLLMTARLRKMGYNITLDMYGSGECETDAHRLAEQLGIADIVSFNGTLPNDELLARMCRHEIFLFTSDRNEGWGAVANESMANGCVLVAGDGIGSSPYLISERQTGILFHSPKTSSGFNHPDARSLDELCEKVAYLLDHPQERQAMRRRSAMMMRDIWSPKTAAERLMKLIELLGCGQDTTFENGPCSKA